MAIIEGGLINWNCHPYMGDLPNPKVWPRPLNNLDEIAKNAIYEMESDKKYHKKRCLLIDKLMTMKSNRIGLKKLAKEVDDQEVIEIMSTVRFRIEGFLLHKHGIFYSYSYHVPDVFFGIDNAMQGVSEKIKVSERLNESNMPHPHYSYAANVSRFSIYKSIGPLAPHKIGKLTLPLTYFITTQDEKVCKIGRSVKVHKRLAALQVANPQLLRLKAIIPGDMESDMHYKWRSLRITGEWFKMSPQLNKFIQHQSILIKEESCK